VVCCLALGVGANAAAFSLFDQLVLRSLPVPKPESLVNLSAPGPKNGSTQCNRIGTCEDVFSYPMFRDLERQQTVFTGIAAHRLFIANVAYRGRASDGDGVLVSGSYFPVLRLTPALGRLFAPEDDRAISGQRVAVLSYAYWTSQLGADSSVLGGPIVVNNKTLTIVGVAPRGFDGTTLGVRPNVFLPITLASDVDIAFGSQASFENRTLHGIFLFARLRPGATIERARTVMRAVYRPILADVEAPLQGVMSDQTRAAFLAREIGMVDGRRGQSELRGATRAPLAFLFAITAVVVLIACANIANLLLARGSNRATEMAVRMSLGAGRRQLITQLLAESCMLALVGGAASLIVAQGTLRLVSSFVPGAMIGAGTALSLELSSSALVFAGAVSLATAVMFGLFPSLHVTRPDLIGSIRSGAGQIMGGHRAAARFRASLVTAQIALSVALLASAGLFIKSLRNIGRVDLGFQMDGVVTFAILPALNGYDPNRSLAFLERVEEKMGAFPGVTGVGATTVPILTGMSNGGNVRVEGFRRDPDTDANTRMSQVGSGYFRTLGIQLLAGRPFTDQDRLGAPKVAVVNEAFAKKFGLGRAPVGKRMALDADSPAGALNVEIVGLVRDTRYADVKGNPPPLVYTPYRQESALAGLAFYVRTSSAPEVLLRSVPATVATLDPNLPVAMLKTLPQQARDNVYLDRMIGAFSAGFAVLATLLSAVGLYGVLTYTVARRTREIGVRMALGADAGRVRAMVLGQVGRLIVVGGSIGVVAALALGRTARSLLYGVAQTEPVVLTLATSLLAVIALGAGYFPARRASRLNPVDALRRD
jgi:predicted permease